VATFGGRVVPITLGTDGADIVEVLALWELGAVVAPLNPRLTGTERAYAHSVLTTVAPPSGASAVLWTSGTSGRPRGVALSADNLVAVTRASADRLSLSDNDVWLASLSLAHVGGLVLVVRSLVLGGTLAATGALDTEALSNALDGGDGGPAPTHVSLVPTQLHRLLEHRGEGCVPDTLACALIGGAHAPERLVRRALDDGWPLCLTYGATEMTSQIATADARLVMRKPGTVGAPLPGIECVTSDDDEILVRGSTRALGYVGDDASPLADADGWYHTGDLGRLDDEGHLWVTGRRIDRIVSGGFTVEAREVEEALREHPSVIDACVVGVPDPEWGERVAAWIEPVVGEFDVTLVDEWIQTRLTAAKRPRLWHTGGTLPRNANGKVDRSAVRGTFGA